MKSYIEKHSPPGMELQSERNVFLLGLIFAALYSMLFLLNYAQAYKNLFVQKGYDYVLRKDATMPYFADLAHSTLNGFLILAVCMLVFIIFRYHYFFRGSKSIYLMRRLPKRFVLCSQCVQIPCMAAFVSILAACVLFWLYIGLYFLITPTACLQDEQWIQMWRVIL